MNKKKSTTPSSFSASGGMGSASILVIFVILCLVSFATLSIVSANADFKLSKKVLERTDAYYAASGQAETILAQLDQTLLSIYETGVSEEEYYAVAGHSKSFMVPLSELQSLEVTVSILYPRQDGDTFYRIEGWQVVATRELDYDSTLPVMQ